MKLSYSDPVTPYRLRVAVCRLQDRVGTKPSHYIGYLRWRDHQPWAETAILNCCFHDVDGDDLRRAAIQEHITECCE